MKKKPLTLHPLNFQEAVTDILKIRPEPKQPKDDAVRDIAASTLPRHKGGGMGARTPSTKLKVSAGGKTKGARPGDRPAPMKQR